MATYGKMQSLHDKWSSGESSSTNCGQFNLSQSKAAHKEWVPECDVSLGWEQRTQPNLLCLMMDAVGTQLSETVSTLSEQEFQKICVRTHTHHAINHVSNKISLEQLTFFLPLPYKVFFFSKLPSEKKSFIFQNFIQCADYWKAKRTHFLSTNFIMS